MSIFLYRLGGAVARRAGLVLGLWVLVLGGLVGGAALIGDHYDDTFTLPGSQSQEGQDLLQSRFGQTGTSGQIMFSVPSGTITGSASATAVADVVKAVGKVPHVSMSNPLKAAIPVISKDKRSTLGTVQFSSQVPSDSTLEAVQRAAVPRSSSDLQTSVGGSAYKTTADPSKLPELMGLAISFVILAITFGSLLAAGMPILTSLMGVGVTLSAVVLVASRVTVSSSSPTLAEMLGLAVGIDYALFLLSRYRGQLSQGLPVAEAMSRALATAGSAVVFAGTTVVIALVGLTVAGIPVLTVMGLAAAAAVTVAVLIALTLLPAIALLLGERLRPKPRRRLRRHSKPAAEPERSGFSGRWVHAVTKWPVVTVVGVIAVLLLAATPARNLDLALPDNSTAPTSSPERKTYDDITATFGPGYNSPLAVTADVITSSDPTSTVNKLADAIKKVPGVVAVTQATPNQGGDTALIQLVPKAGQTAPSTAVLVQALRARSPELEKKFHVHNLLVTGPTAINIDVSQRLGSSLLPFGAIVIGLSLLLLMVVFRSLAVPVKATFGYLLSVGAALGAVVLVFQKGVFDSALPGLANGPIVSFLPIFVMGVLFGLAMDYEMFLVSAMREEYVHTGDPRQAVYGGFHASSKVVTAAALIMVSVFVAFIPGGSSTIKPIALGLAVGVFVDAFIVRMTFVPAVLVLLGRAAWWLPGWLDRLLPTVDVEGAALHRKVAAEQWQERHGAMGVLARDLVVRPGERPMQVAAPVGELLRVDVPGTAARRDLGLVLVGRQAPAEGELVVADCLLPEQRGSVTRIATLVELGRHDGRPVADRLDERARVAHWTGRRRRTFVGRAEAVLGDVAAPQTGVVDAALAVAGGAKVVVLLDPGPTDPATDQEADDVVALLLRAGLTVVVLAEPAVREAPPREQRVPAMAGEPAVAAADSHTEEVR